MKAVRHRPSLERIVEAVLAEFGADRAAWSTGRRVENVSRAAAAWLARRRFGYRTREIADALGYRSHGGVAAGIQRVERSGQSVLIRLRRVERELAAND